MSRQLLKRDFLDIYLITFSESVTSKIQNISRPSFYWKCLKFNLDSKNGAKIWEKFFCFWDKIISIGIVKLSLLRTGYFSSAANVLTSSPKIWHVNKGDFFEHNFLTSDKWLWWRCCDQDFESAWASLPYCLSKDPPKRDFLDIYLTTFSESLTSKIKSVWGSYFCSKCLKFNLDFKNAERNWENLFCFLDNCIWIGIVQFSLLRTGYFSLEANVLTSSPKILDVNKRDFFQLILFGSGQWIW